MMAVGVVRGIVSWLSVVLLVLGGFFGVLVPQTTTAEPDSEAKTIIVDINGTGDYTSIQEAIDNANTGDKIYVWAGTYYENIIVNKSITIIGNGSINTTITNNSSWYVIYITASWINLTGFKITNNSQQEQPENDGIVLHNVEHVHIHNNILTNNEDGIFLWNSNNNTIENNTVVNNFQFGIDLFNSDSNIFIENSLNYNTWGIYLGKSSFNNMANNTLRNNGIGLALQDSSITTIKNNILNSTIAVDIILSDSHSIQILNNTMEIGLSIRGDKLQYWNTHVIDNKTRVNKKPIHYWKNIIGGEVPADGGQVILANCKNIIVQDANFSDLNIGIQLGFSTNNTIVNNNFKFIKSYFIYISHSNSNLLKNNTGKSNNSNGIYLTFSDLNRIENNMFSSNKNSGLSFWRSNNNTIRNNICIYNNLTGIRLYKSNNNTFINNTCKSNTENGIYFENSNENFVNDNNLSNNNRGIFLRYSNLNYVSNNFCNLNGNNGFYLHYSNLNVIINNSCSSNMFQAIVLDESSHNILENNKMSNHWMGISFESNSNSNEILKNIIFNNSEFGLFLGDDSNNNNIIYYNQFIFNKKQAINRGNNYWNNSLNEGNYWSDYTGIDNGANGRIAGDGIGDTNIPHLGLDYYPFVNQSGWLEENRTQKNIIENEQDKISEDEQGLINCLSIRFILLILIVVLVIVIIFLKLKMKKE